MGLKTPQTILEKRLAKGEIMIKEYREIKKELGIPLKEGKSEKIKEPKDKEKK